MKESKSKIDKLFDIASKSKEKLRKETIGKATERQLSGIRASGIDISENYVHTLANYNKLTFEKNTRGQDIIIYQKSYEDGTTLYAEEVRVGRKELAMASMYKTKRTQHKVESSSPDGLMPSNGVLSSTSETPSEFSASKDTENSETSKQNSKKSDVRPPGIPTAEAPIHHR